MPIKNPQITAIKKVAKTLESPMSMDCLQYHCQRWFVYEDHSKNLPILKNPYYILPNKEMMKWANIGGAIAQIRGQNYNNLRKILLAAISSVSDPHERLLLQEAWIDKIPSGDHDLLRREQCSRQAIDKKIDKAINHINKNYQDRILNYQPQKLSDYSISLTGILNPFDTPKQLFRHYYFHPVKVDVEDADSNIFLEQIKIISLIGCLQDDRIYKTFVLRFLQKEAINVLTVKLHLKESGVKKRLKTGFKTLDQFIIDNSSGCKW